MSTRLAKATSNQINTFLSLRRKTSGISYSDPKTFGFIPKASIRSILSYRIFRAVLVGIP
jgi:hypothetical protein